MNSYTVNRTGFIAGALVAVAAGLLGAVLAEREPAHCDCGGTIAAPVHPLPEVRVVAKRLGATVPAGRD